MQAKDIPDAAFLDAIEQVKDLRDLGPYPIRDLGASCWDIAAILAGHPEDLADLDNRTRYVYPNMPFKVVIASRIGANPVVHGGDSRSFNV